MPSARHPGAVAVERSLTAARASVIIPVVVLALAAVGAFAYATYVAADRARHIVDKPIPVGNNIGDFVAVIDLFLVGTTLLIAAIGLYELFLTSPAADRSPHLPAWLVIADLSDLKARVISMIVLVTAVTFVEAVVDTNRGHILDLGVAIGVVIVALTGYLRLGDARRGER